MVQEMTLILLKWTALYFLIINCFYGALLLLSRFTIKRFKKIQSTEAIDLPAVSFLVPAYNEETLIVETIQTYLSLPLDNKEVIVVNDGSRDKTMKLLQIMFQLKKVGENSYQSITQPCLKVIEAPHMGKAQALNFGLAFTKFELICTMDADTIPNAAGVEACLKAFALDPKLMAAGGIIQVLSSNELKNNSPLRQRSQEWLTSFQRIEYLRTFVCERLGWSLLGSTILISGAFCLLKKEAIQKIGGFCPRSITEDFDLIIRLRRAFDSEKYHFDILPVTTCYTQVPRTLKHLSKQRMRWQMGLVQTLLQNSRLLFNPTHRFMGMLAIPYFWIVEALSPLFVFGAYVALPVALLAGWIDPLKVILFLTLGSVFNLMITMIGIYYDNKYVSKNHSWSLVRNIFGTLLLHMGYKQMTNWWRLLALFRSFTKNPLWGEKPRVEITHRT